MISWWTLSLAWAGSWDGMPTDVVVSRPIVGDPITIHALVADLATWPDLFSGGCATEWRLNAKTTGVGTRARVRYVIGGMRRPLSLVITEDQPGQMFEIEHEGNRGWFTQVTYAPTADATRTEVTLTTPLAPPPWPLRGLFHRRIRPAFEVCYEEALLRIATRIEPAY